jgi:hypothetical protein
MVGSVGTVGAGTFSSLIFAPIALMDEYFATLSFDFGSEGIGSVVPV